MKVADFYMERCKAQSLKGIVISSVVSMKPSAVCHDFKVSLYCCDTLKQTEKNQVIFLWCRSHSWPHITL